MAFVRSKTIPTSIKILFTILIILGIHSLSTRILIGFTKNYSLYSLFLMILEISMYITYVLSLCEYKVSKRIYFALLTTLSILLGLLLLSGMRALFMMDTLPNFLKYKMILNTKYLLCIMSIVCLMRYLQHENPHPLLSVDQKLIAPTWVKVFYTVIIISGFSTFSQVGLEILSMATFMTMNPVEFPSVFIQLIFSTAILCAWITWILTLTNQKLSTPFVIINLIFLLIGTFPMFLLTLNTIGPAFTKFPFFYFTILGPCLSGIISLFCCYLYLMKSKPN